MYIGFTRLLSCQATNEIQKFKMCLNLMQPNLWQWQFLQSKRNC